MKLSTYIRIEGSSFDPAEFHLHVGASVDGTIGQRGHNGQPLRAGSLAYWRTLERHCTVEEVSSSLSRAVECLLPAYGSYVATGKPEVTAVIVCRYEEGEEPIGLYFEPTTIELLGKMKAGIDIDAVHDLR